VRIENNLKEIIHNAQHVEEKLLVERMQVTDTDARRFRLISILLIATILVLIAGIYGVIAGRARIFKKSEEQSSKTIADYKSALDTASIVAITDHKVFY